MPQAIPYAIYVVAGWIGALGVGATVAVGIATVVVYAAAAYAMSAAARAMAPKSSKQKGAGYEANYGGTSEAIRIVYGSVRVGGMHTIPPIATGGDGKFLNVVLSLTGHEVDSITDVYFDKTQIASGSISAIAETISSGLVTAGTYADVAWIRRYTGTTTQTRDYLLNAAYPSAFGTDFRGRGISYIAVQLKHSDKIFPAGVPNITCQIQGKKCYDPRTATTIYTSNPSVIARDYLVNHVGFDSAQIDDSLVIAAANICDQTVAIPTAATQKRYQCNLLLTTAETWEENLRSIIDSMRGRCVYRDGKWRIYAGAWDVSGDSISMADWIGPTRVRASSPPEERWNAVRVWYVDAARGYQRVDCFPRRNASYETADGDRIWMELEIPGCSNEYEAQRHGEFCLRASRNQLVISGRLRPEFVKLSTWDTVSVTDTDYGWASKTFRVLSMEMSPDGGVDVALVEEGSATWTDLAEAEYNAWPTGVTIDPGYTAPSPRTNFAASPGTGSIDFSWAVNSDAMANEMTRLIEYASSGYAHLGTELWRGNATRVNIAKSDATTRYYWAQGVVNSYVGAYTPNTFGYPAAANSLGAGSVGSPGLDGMSVGLSLPAVTLAANVAGTVADYSPANGSLLVFKGGVDVSSYATTRASSQAGVTGTVNSADNAPWAGQSKGRYQVTAVTSDQGVLWCEAVYSGTTYVRPFVVSKAKVGSSGVAGVDGISAWLSNPTVSLPASLNGFVPDFTTAEGLYRVMQGVNSVAASATFSVTSQAGVSGTINTADNSPVAGKIRGYYQVTAVTSNQGILHLRAQYGTAVFDSQFGVSKSLGGQQGTPGTNANTATMLNLVATAQAFSFSGSGTNIGVSTIGFDAVLQNVGGTAEFRANNYNLAGTMISSYALAGAGNTGRILHVNSFTQGGSTAYCTITTSLAPGLYDYETINRLTDGTMGSSGTPGSPGIAALTGLLTNDNVTLPASANGYVSNYAGANGAFVLMWGVNSVNVNSITFATAANPQSLTHVFSGNGTYAVTGGLDIGEDTAALTLRGTFNGTVVDQVFTLAKAASGWRGGQGPISGNLLMNGDFSATDANSPYLLMGWQKNGAYTAVSSTIAPEGGRAMIMMSGDGGQHANDAFIPVDPFTQELELALKIRSTNGTRQMYWGLACYNSDKAFIGRAANDLWASLGVTSGGWAGSTAICVAKPSSGDLAWPGYISNPSFVYKDNRSGGTGYDANMRNTNISSYNTALSTSYDVLTLGTALTCSVSAGYLGADGGTYKYANGGVLVPTSNWNEVSAAYYGADSPNRRQSQENTGALRWGTRYVQLTMFPAAADAGDIVVAQASLIQRARELNDYVLDPQTRMGAGWEMYDSPATLADGAFTNSAYAYFAASSGPSGAGYVQFQVWSKNATAVYRGVSARIAGFLP